jgi:hypothetical protein
MPVPRHFLTSLLAAAALWPAASAAQSPPAAPRVSRDTLATLRQAAATARAAGDTSAEASALEELGLEHWRADRFDSALVHLLQSRDLAQRLGDSVAVARRLNAIGSSHYQLGNYELALQSYLRALDIRRAQGNARSQAVLYANIGKAYEDWRQYDRALQSLDSAVALAARADDRRALGYAHLTRAGVLVRVRRFAEARTAVAQALTAYFSEQPPLSPRDAASAQSIAEMLLGEMALAEGRLTEARTRFADIAARAARGNTRRGRAQASLGLARVEVAAGQWAAAARAYTTALDDAGAIGNRAFRLEALEGLSRVAEARGDAPSALRLLRAHDALRDSVFDARTAQRVAGLELEAEAERQRAAARALVRAQEVQAADLRQQRLLSALAGTLLALTLLFVAALWRANRAVRERETALALRNAELQDAMQEVQVLSGFIPICANCKNVRDDAGYWQSVEAYLGSRSAAQFSHSICNACGPKLYGEDWVPHAVDTAEHRPASNAPAAER